MNSDVTNQLAFLVLDDVEEYEIHFKSYSSRCKALCVNIRDEEYFHTNFRELLLSGRRKNRSDWDLKMLCALTLITRFYMNIIQIPISGQEEISQKQDQEEIKNEFFKRKSRQGSVAEDSRKLKELHHYCKVVIY